MNKAMILWMGGAIYGGVMFLFWLAFNRIGPTPKCQMCTNAPATEDNLCGECWWFLWAQEGEL